MAPANVSLPEPSLLASPLPYVEVINYLPPARSRFHNREDIALLQLACWHEARGERFVDRIPVIEVILNRAHQSNRTVRQVLEQPNQFSWWRTKRNQRPHGNPPEWQECYHIAYSLTLHDQRQTDCTYFHHRNIRPEWTSRLQRCLTAGSHVFWRH